LAETRLSQLEGRFEFVSGQLRDIQLNMHARFDDVDKRFDDVEKRFDDADKRFDGLENKVDSLSAELRAMPKVIAEMIVERRK
jgi:tetrahydromethanopterin S-methyltransferase subunit G